MKRPPSYWWKFDHSTKTIIVQSDYAGGARLAAFPYFNNTAQWAIDQATKLIEDFEAGRKTPSWNKVEYE